MRRNVRYKKGCKNIKSLSTVLRLRNSILLNSTEYLIVSAVFNPEICSVFPRSISIYSFFPKVVLLPCFTSIQFHILLCTLHNHHHKLEICDVYLYDNSVIGSTSSFYACRSSYFFLFLLGIGRLPGI